MVLDSGIEPLSTLAPVLQTGDPTIDLFAEEIADKKVDKFLQLKRCKPIEHSAWWEGLDLNQRPQSKSLNLLCALSSELPSHIKSKTGGGERN